MPIASIECAWIRTPLPKLLSRAHETTDSSVDIVCRVRTDDGIEGIGTAVGKNPDRVCFIVDQALTPLLIGEHEEPIERIWDRLRLSLLGPDVLRPAQWSRRAILAAIGLIDQALWDIRAKRVGVPMYQVLGGTRRPIKAYLSDMFFQNGTPIEEMFDCAEKTIDQHGYRAIKVRIGRGVEDSVDRVRRTRERFGDSFGIAADANQTWELTTALRVAEALEPYNLLWLEEPIRPHAGVYRPHGGHDANGDTGVLANQTSVPIALGENHVSLSECTDLVERAAIGYMQFDATLNGGVTEWLRVANLCQRFGIRMAPHSAPHIHAHLVSTVPHGDWIESYECERKKPAWPYLFDGFPTVVNGAITPSDGPGWGFSINEDFLAKHGTLTSWHIESRPAAINSPVFR